MKPVARNLRRHVSQDNGKLLRWPGAHLLACLVLLVIAGLTANAQPLSPEQPPSQGRVIPVNGMRMYVEIYGEGPPLLLVHAFTASGQTWRPFVGEFAKNFRVIVPDLRGHGWSDNPRKEFTHRLMAADLFALLDALNVGPVRAIGVSNGALVLMHMAVQQRDRIEAMVLVGAAPYLGEEARTIMRNSTVDNMTAQDWTAARQVHRLGDEQIRLLRATMNQFKDNTDDVNFTPPMLAKISARTLIVHGDHDPVFPLAMPMELRQSIPHSYLWVVPGGGHIPAFEQPVLFLQNAREFFRSS